MKESIPVVVVQETAVRYKVWVEGHEVGSAKYKVKAIKLAQQIRDVLKYLGHKSTVQRKDFRR